jgi:hypothetical protein
MSRTWYWVIGGAAVVIAVVAMFTYAGNRESERAIEKAQELSSKLDRAGLRVPHQDIIVRSLGDDGGAVCENAQDGLEGLTKAILADALANGASHVGRRPIIADRRLVQGQLLILETYCPDELADFREELEDLEFDDVID